MEKDLFGNEIKPQKPYKGGYAAAPGTGPEGETCGTCIHRRKRSFSKEYRKCFLVKWSRGPGTDIVFKAPACHYWKGEK